MSESSIEGDIVFARKAIRYYISSLSPCPLSQDQAQYFFTHGAALDCYAEACIEHGVGAWLRGWFTGEWPRKLLEITASRLGATVEDFVMLEEALKSGEEKPFIRPALLAPLNTQSAERLHIIAKQAFDPGGILSSLVSAEMVSRCLPMDAYRYYYGEITDGGMYHILSAMARWVIKEISKNSPDKNRAFFFNLNPVLFGSLSGNLTNFVDQMWCPESGYIWDNND